MNTLSMVDCINGHKFFITSISLLGDIIDSSVKRWRLLLLALNLSWPLFSFLNGNDYGGYLVFVPPLCVECMSAVMIVWGVGEVVHSASFFLVPRYLVQEGLCVSTCCKD